MTCFQSEEKKFKTLMKEAGKSSSIVEEICSTENLDKSTYDEARQKAAKILLEQKAETSEKKTFGKNKKRFGKKQQ